jgi:hypothetical protein
MRSNFITESEEVVKALVKTYSMRLKRSPHHPRSRQCGDSSPIDSARV